MNAAAPIQTQDDAIALQPPLPVRRLHNFIYCPRLFYYQWVENLFEENADTVAGSHVHRNVDKASSFDDDKKAALAEGLPQCDADIPVRMDEGKAGHEGKADKNVRSTCNLAEPKILLMKRIVRHQPATALPL